MDDSIKLEIFGTTELANLFDELTKANQNKIIKGGFRKSGNIILKEAKRNLQAGLKNSKLKRLEKAFRIEDIKESDTVIGVNIGNTNYKSKWLEFGTKSRHTKKYKKTKSSRPTGKIMGIHFLEKATESKGEEAVNTLYENIKQAFDLLIKKYSK